MSEMLINAESEGADPWGVYYWEQKQSQARFDLKLSAVNDELNQAIVEAVSEGDPAVAAAKEKLQRLREEAYEAYTQEMGESLDKLLEALGSGRWRPRVPDPASGRLA
ncbi:hypothetical protein F4X86_01405 [Candidatus Saccharibacteria bacterium]|nr:hypothetical protein [Candidatus Saccharibacteria bacterium]